MTGLPGAPALVQLLRERSLTVAAAESLTAGLVTARIADVPGASAVLRGGVTTYATETKGSVLGLDAALLDHVVSRMVAESMADRARVVFGADLGIATTGVAGPDPLDGQPPGTVWIAVATRDGIRSELLHLSGSRAAIRSQAADAAIALGLDVVESRAPDRE